MTSKPNHELAKNLYQLVDKELDRMHDLLKLSITVENATRPSGGYYSSATGVDSYSLIKRIVMFQDSLMNALTVHDVAVQEKVAELALTTLTSPVCIKPCMWQVFAENNIYTLHDNGSFTAYDVVAGYERTMMSFVLSRITVASLMYVSYGKIVATVIEHGQSYKKFYSYNTVTNCWLSIACSAIQQNGLVDTVNARIDRLEEAMQELILLGNTDVELTKT